MSDVTPSNPVQETDPSATLTFKELLWRNNLPFDVFVAGLHKHKEALVEYFKKGQTTDGGDDGWFYEPNLTTFMHRKDVTDEVLVEIAKLGALRAHDDRMEEIRKGINTDPEVAYWSKNYSLSLLTAEGAWKAVEQVLKDGERRGLDETFISVSAEYPVDTTTNLHSFNRDVPRLQRDMAGIKLMLSCLPEQERSLTCTQALCAMADNCATINNRFPLNMSGRCCLNQGRFNEMAKYLIDQGADLQKAMEQAKHQTAKNLLKDVSIEISGGWQARSRKRAVNPLPDFK